MPDSLPTWRNTTNTMPTWRDAANAMLEGAGVLAEHRGDFYDNPSNPTAACALGCAQYHLILQGALSTKYHHYLISSLDPGYQAIIELEDIFLRRYGVTIPEVNDERGRDAALYMVKELLNESTEEDA